MTRTSTIAAAAVSFMLLAASGRAQDAPVGTPGLRQVTGQSPVVAGNAAGARERALDEALRQAVDQALAEMVEPQTRAVQAKAVKALEARARSYVRRYRTLEEGEAGGTYTIRLEAEVDEVALRRATDRWGQPPATGPAPAGPGARPVAPGLLLIPAAGGVSDAAPALATALSAAGARASVGDTAADPAAAVAAASRAGLPQVAFLAAQATEEGAVRGTGKVAVSCRVAARIVAVPSGLPVAEQASAPRAFADRDDAARADCLARAASDLAPRMVPAGGGTAASAGGDLRTVTVEADVVEPAAIPALLKTIRSVGAVSSAELRRVSAGRAEVRVRTRTLAPALAPTLSRDASGMITLSNVAVVGDMIRLRVRLRAAPTPPASTPATP